MGTSTSSLINKEGYYFFSFFSFFHHLLSRTNQTRRNEVLITHAATRAETTPAPGNTHFLTHTSDSRRLLVLEHCRVRRSRWSTARRQRVPTRHTLFSGHMELKHHVLLRSHTVTHDGAAGGHRGLMRCLHSLCIC